MLMNIIMLFTVMFMIGMYSFFLKSNHLLNMLLSLEFFSLIIFVCLFVMLWSNPEKYILTFYITFCVCEGAFGLALLVSLIRFVGNDYLQSLSFLKC
uniref:NADH-ubiquinone oxidoreductase chain 4L n=1 Tax=Eolachesilla chilensis TaxID=297977 RepID=A0A8K1ZFF2_9NEOP|nr:NADH dehydrogenase subunit 4L [Eolachesilla chilensis]